MTFNLPSAKLRTLVALFACMWMICVSGQAANTTVAMKLLEFVPRNTTVNVGDTITWTNLDPVAHDSVSGSGGNPDGTWQSSLFGKGRSYTVKFLKSGTYPYYCTPHWDCCDMVGQVSVVAPNSPPEIHFLSPGTNILFSPATITFQVFASDPDGSIARVEFLINNQSVGFVNTQPYTLVTSNIANGQYNLTAIATDNLGATAIDARTIFVTDRPSNILPSVSIVSPQEGATIEEASTVALVVNATDLDGSITQVHTFLNGLPVSNFVAPPYSSTSTPLQQGNYRFSAIAIDDRGGAVTNEIAFRVVPRMERNPPRFTLQPVGKEVFSPETVQLVAGVSGTAPFYFHWYRGSFQIPNATNNVLTITNTTTSDSGSYFLAVSNAFGFAQSSNVVVNVKAEICNYTLGTNDFSLPQGPAMRSFSLATSRTCSWIASSGDAFWIHFLSATQGIGPATISVSFDANFAPLSRTGLVTVGTSILKVIQAGTGLSPALASDFNHDFLPDLLLASSTGDIGFYSSSGALTNGYVANGSGLKIPKGWQLSGTYDFDGNGTPDLVFVTPTRGMVVWLLDGSQLLQQVNLGRAALPASWKLIGIVSSKPGSQAAVLHHPQGYVAAWTFRNFQNTDQQLLNNGNPVPTDWRPVGLGDFNKDGNLDLLWQNQNGTLMAWFLKNGQVTGGQLLSGLPRIAPVWSLVSILDYDLNGSSDLLFQNKNGDTALWLLNGVNLKSTIHPFFPSPLGAQWKVLGPK